MGNLIRRNKAIPVQTRRVGGEGEQILVPGNPGVPAAVPQPAPPVAPQAGAAPPPPQSVTQNIFYITNPAPVAAPSQPSAQPVAPPPPQEVHYHTTVHHALRARTPNPGTSTIGLISVLLGGLSCASLYVPQLSWAREYSIRLAEAGLVCGGIGMLAAILLKRSATGVPGFGLALSAVAYGLCLFNGGQLHLPTENTGAPTPVQPANPPGKSALVSHPPAPAGGQTTSPPAVRNVVVTPAPKVNPPTPPAVAPPAAADVNAAMSRLETVRLSAAQKLGIDYPAAKLAVDQTSAELQRARISFAPGSVDLIAASQRKMVADTALKEMQDRLASDPAVAAAQQALATLRTPPQPASTR